MKNIPKQLYSEIPLAQTVVNFCFLKKIQHIVISPGSRNAPLTQGFTQNSFFNTYSIVDERSAAFFALGLGTATKSPRCSCLYFGFCIAQLLSSSFRSFL